MRLPRGSLKFGFVSAFVLIAAACSSTTIVNNTVPDDSDSGSSDGGGTTTDDSGTVTSNDSGSKTPDSGGVDSGPSTDIPPITSPDGFGAARTACINEINRLRATQGHAAYTLWTDAGIDTCVDSQATSDETSGSPHQAWLVTPSAICDGDAQDECQGQGVTAADVVTCLDQMWAEKDKPNCSGCAACSAASFNESDPTACPNCDYYGTMGGGYECGHYVNMSADWLAKVDCGFSALGGWSTQNFSQ